MSEKKYTQEDMLDAFVSGFNQSGEGYNGEYPPYSENWKPEQEEADLAARFEKFMQQRNEDTTQPEPSVVLYEHVAPTLEEAQRIIGGYVVMMTLPDGSQLLVDEDGIEKGLPRN